VLLRVGLELAFAIGVTAVMSAQNAQHAFELGLLSYALAMLLSYILDVKVYGETLQEFLIRFGVAFVICFPAGMFLASRVF